MLREFIKCNSLAERISIVEKSAPSDWNESELATVVQIVGLTDKVKGMDVEETLEVIHAALSEKLNESLEDDTTIKTISRLSEEEEPIEEGPSKEELIETTAYAAQVHLGGKVFPN